MAGKCSAPTQCQPHASCRCPLNPALNFRKGANLLCSQAGICLGASLPLKSPDFLPVWLSPSPLWGQDLEDTQPQGRLRAGHHQAPRDSWRGHAMGGHGGHGANLAYCPAGGSEPVLVVLITHLQHLDQLPALRPFPSEGQPAGNGRNRFQNHPRVRNGAWLSFCNLFPRAGRRLCHTLSTWAPNRLQ